MERISFLQFRNLFARKSKMSKNNIAIFAPIIYRLEDKYFNACKNYLETGIMEEILFDEYSTEIIVRGMGCSYIEALVVLNNLEKFPDSACYIFTPRTME